MSWTILDKFVEINSPWLTLIGEKIRDENNNLLDYWRVKKADSVIIIVIQNNNFILPKPIYRHGLGDITLDFAGGRLNIENNINQVILNILEKELNIKPLDVIKTRPINEKPWPINSSFSNQKLWGFVTEINHHTEINSCEKYPINHEGINRLLNDLICLQCRGILLEWLRLNHKQKSITI